MQENQALVALMLWHISSTTKCSKQEAINTVRDVLKTSAEILAEVGGTEHKKLCNELQAELEAKPVVKKQSDALHQQMLPLTTENKPELVVVKRGKPGKADLVVAMPSPVAQKTAVTAPVSANSAEDEWASADSPQSLAVASAAISKSGAVPPPPPIPTAPWAKAGCAACSGTGYNSKGGVCAVCKTAEKQPEKAAEISPVSAPTLKLKPKPSNLSIQVLYTEMLCEGCQNDQIVFTLPLTGNEATKATYVCQKCNTVGAADLDGETVQTIRNDGKLLATAVSAEIPTSEMRGRKKADPVVRLPIQQPPDEKAPSSPATPPDIRKLVDGIVGYESPPINCEATRFELKQSVDNWQKDRVVKKWEELSGKVWKENEMSMDKLKTEIVNGLLGKIGAE
jgi:hypothetical protein